MPTRFFDDITKALSSSRLSRYEISTGERDKIAHYLWNTCLCEALYPVLQGVEVVLRNNLDSAISTLYGPWWFDASSSLKLRKSEAGRIIEAQWKLRKKLSRPLVPGDIIAAQAFSFWTSLFSRYYGRPDMLWPKLLGPVFPYLNTNRSITKIRPRLEAIRDLRNRVFHHEPILHLSDLAYQHTQIIETIEWMNPSALQLFESIDRFPPVYSSGQVSCNEKVDVIIQILQERRKRTS